MDRQTDGQTDKPPFEMHLNKRKEKPCPQTENGRYKNGRYIKKLNNANVTANLTFGCDILHIDRVCKIGRN